MRKRNLQLLCCSLFATGAMAQNIQLHYDLGSALYSELSERPKLTTTIEMFKPDKWGNTFFFVDMDYADGKVASAYWELARELRFWDPPFSIHIEYNGGLNHIDNAYLGGLSYAWNSADFNRGFSVSAMYKYIHHNPEPNSFQLTGIWHLHFLDGKCSFTGFADFWREKHTDIKGNVHDYVFMTEPQFWVNLNKFKRISDKFKLSVGTEWEMTHNFAIMDGFYIHPTIALKWSFE